MSFRVSVRILLPVLACTALVACADDDPGPSGAAGASVSSTSADPSASSGGSSPDPAVADDCAGLRQVVTDIAEGFPDGVDLATGEVPNDDQVAALTALVEGFESMEIEDTELASQRSAVVAVAGVIIGQAESGAVLTDAEQAGFTEAMSDIFIRCEGAG